MNNSTISRVMGNQIGQSIVEISLIVPLLLIALYIPADFGIALFTGHLTQNAAREGALIGARTVNVTSTSNQPCSSSHPIVTAVCQRLPARLQSPTVTVSLLTGGATDCARSVSVRVGGSYDFFLYQLVRMLGIPMTNNSVTITRTTQMRYEFQPPENNTPCTP